jgi:hypothetical protein
LSTHILKKKNNGTGKIFFPVDRDSSRIPDLFQFHRQYDTMKSQLPTAGLPDVAFDLPDYRWPGSGIEFIIKVLGINMDPKKTVKIFISYAHADKIYFKLLIEGIKKFSKNSATIRWETWDDSRIAPGQLWHQAIKEQIHQCDFAILLVSGNFLYSDYIKREEFSEFLNRQRLEGFLFFPILVGPCDFSQWAELGERQFFIPTGDQFGEPEIKDFTYADLVTQTKSNGKILPNPHRERYHMALVKALEGVMAKYTTGPNTPNTRADYFKTVKSSDTLEPGDIFVSRKRARTNADFYWQRETDERILATLQKNESLLILGNSLAGKTRALFEALKKLENTWVLAPQTCLSLFFPLFRFGLAKPG